MATKNCMLMCELCCAVFTKNSNLKRHIKNVHFPERKFICEHCSKSYKTKCSLMRHITSNHSESAKKKIVYWQCPICIFESDKSTMLEHYRLVHNLDTSSTTFKFNSLDEFQNWKQTMENESSSKFVRWRNKKFSNKLRYFYRCHRDGFYKTRGNNIRRLKKSGSNKINAHCPAKIDVIVNESTGVVSVKYMQNHLGHKMEKTRLSLNFTDKNFLLGCLDKGKTEDYDVLCEDKKVELNGINIKTEEISTNLKSNCFSTIFKESRNIVPPIEVFRTSLLEKFQLLLTKIENLEEGEVLSKELSKIENKLNNYKNSGKQFQNK